MMKVALFTSQFTPPARQMLVGERLSIADILRQVEAPVWFWEFGAVRLGGHMIPRENWGRVHVKPDAEGVLELFVVPQSKSTALLIGTIAVALLATAVSGGLLGPASLGLLGASFAAGGLGAVLAGAAIGLAGTLALTALSAPPALSAGPGAQKEFSQAGISGNVIGPLETLPVVFGSILVSPPILAPVYTTFDGDHVTINGVFGVQGRCLIEAVLVNGLEAAQIAGLLYETREGGPADTARTIATYTVLEQRDGVIVSNFDTQLENTKNDRLLDQTTPANSDSKHHYFKTDGAWDEIRIRLVFPGGIVETDAAAVGVVPLRLDIRKVGDATWRKFPTIHIQDIRKGGGPLRTEITVKRQLQPGGRHFCTALDEYPIFELNNKTGAGQTFEYVSDSYFSTPSTWAFAEIPTMTAATTSGVTMSASSTNGADAAWQAADLSSASHWRAANNSLPAWLKIQFAAAKTIRSYFLRDNWSSSGAAAESTAPTAWTLEGSNNDVNWTLLQTEDVINLPQQMYVGQVNSPGSYIYYRFTFSANNGAANQDLRISLVAMSLEDAPGSYLGDGGAGGFNGVEGLRSTGGLRCRYGSLSKNGATFYLDPAQWDAGEYEVRLRRGVAFQEINFNSYSYEWEGSAANADFFEHRVSSGFYLIRIGQKNFRSDTQVEVFQTWDYTAPFDASGIALIAVSAPDISIGALSAQFTSYARTWNGAEWADTPVTTQNPAALYRQLMLDGPNADPLPGELLDEDAMVAWYNRCVTAAHQCNAILQGRTVRDGMKLLASCGYASPRESNLWSVTEDYDTSADPIVQNITPLESRDLGTIIAIPRLPHAIRAEYSDDTDKYSIAHAIIYRDGYTAANATLIETISYPGFTNTAKVTARATFDLLQGQFRGRRYGREMGHAGYRLGRGDLVGLTDDVLDKAQSFGIIRAVTTSGGNVVSITIDNLLPLSAGQSDIATVSSITALTDILDTSQAMGIAIQCDDGTVLVKQISEVTDSNLCTFTTPFADTGVVKTGLTIGAGVHGQSYRRCRVVSVIPTGIDTRQLTLADEAPEIFA